MRPRRFHQFIMKFSALINKNAIASPHDDADRQAASQFQRAHPAALHWMRYPFLHRQCDGIDGRALHRMRLSLALRLAHRLRPRTSDWPDSVKSRARALTAISPRNRSVAPLPRTCGRAFPSYAMVCVHTVVLFSHCPLALAGLVSKDQAYLASSTKV